MDFEKLGSFYLGREYDVPNGKSLDRLLMYDARDLTTHAICVGMTGSGKTGLCIDILEEAAIDRVPALILDPKGDITNLLLQFPELRPQDFRPWINPDDARRKGMSLDEFAASQAELWEKGLSGWGQDKNRIQLLNNSAEFTIYTPGSEAGVPVSVLQSFEAPDLSWSDHAELLRERIEGTVSALLGLIGIDANPVQSQEHIFLSNLFEHFWRQGENLDIKKLILSIQNPPFKQLGVFDLDTVFPAKARFELAMGLNNILASPSFASWLKGHPIDIRAFLSTSGGLPRHSIFYLAHLNESERIFFVTMLLNQLITWMRSQSGTTSLRALVYMDEIFGFFPPVANPPSKKPLLTLLKQSRAFGVGLLLATQNPVDLDYKGLTNAGTWFIGRLQTERDKSRLLDGLESANPGAGFSRGDMDKLISNLGKRVFLMHNVHASGPVAFQTRWAMSYLRGPLTRTQIQDLTAENKSSEGQTKESQQRLTPTREPESEREKSESTGTVISTQPSLSPDIDQTFLPILKTSQSAVLELEANEQTRLTASEHSLIYRPGVVGLSRVHFIDRRKDINESEELCLFAEISASFESIDWQQARSFPIDFARLADKPEREAHFEQIPDSINEPKELKAIEKNLDDYLYRNRTLKILYSPALDKYSKVGEEEADFRLRLTQAAREQRDDEVDKLDEKYQKKLTQLEDRIRRAKLALDKKETTSESRGTELLVSVGESVLGMFLGRRSMRSASSAVSKYRMRKTAKLAVEEAEEKLETLQEEADALKEELRVETSKITRKWDETLADFEEISITPRHADVEILLLAIGWEPCWRVEVEDQRGVRRVQFISACM